MRLPRSRVALLVFGSIVFSAAAQLLFRYGMMHTGAELTEHSADGTAGWLASVPSADARAVLAGLVLYAASFLCWLRAITELSLSFAYPLLSLSYVLVYFGAVYWPGLGETGSWLRLFGIALIIAGVAAVSWSATSK